MSISRNASYNVIGAALPPIITLVTVPIYLESVGIERYGVLTLCWILLGHFGMFDLGLGPAVARGVAVVDRGADAAISLFWTALWMSLLLGALGAGAIYIAAAFYFLKIADLSALLTKEAWSALPVLAAILPVTMVSSVLAGALQGRERFLAYNLGTTSWQVLSALLPLATFYWMPNLHGLVLGALIARILPLPFFYWRCTNALPIHPPKGYSRERANGLLRFGGWFTLSNIISALMTTFDRLVIGSTIGPAAVSIYSIAYGVVSRLIVVPHSLGSAIFPRFAQADNAEQGRLFMTGAQAILAISTPMAIALVAVLEPFFNIWIGAKLAAQALPVAYLLVFGFWIYGIGHIAWSMLNAVGRPKAIAKLMALEVIPYWAALFVGMKAYGIAGAAAVWSLRTIAECFFLMMLGRVPSYAVKKMVIPGALTLLAIVSAVMTSGLPRYLLLVLILCLALTWSAFNLPETLKTSLLRFTRSLLRTRKPEA